MQEIQIMTMAERLLEVGSQLPPPALAELIDFAEFLRQKTALHQSSGSGSLLELMGGLENSATFAGSPLEIQRKMRHEWD